jgi:hypothetical protein
MTITMTRRIVGFGFVSRSLACAVAVLVAAVGLLASVSVAWAGGAVAWSVRVGAVPGEFSHEDAAVCFHIHECDRYEVLVTNVGEVPSSGTVTLTDRLPAGIVTSAPTESRFYGGALFGAGEGTPWSCLGGGGESVVTCTLQGPVPAGAAAPGLEIFASSPGIGVSGSLLNEVSVAGGGAVSEAVVRQSTPVAAQPLIHAPFELSELALEADTAGGVSSTQAGGHPWSQTLSFAFPTASVLPQSLDTEPEPYYEPGENMKTVVTDLPAGFLGDALATERCTTFELIRENCPHGSLVGTLSYRQGYTGAAEWQYTGQLSGQQGIYNIVPQAGYPAEFATTRNQVPVYFYPSVVHGPQGYHLQVSSPGILNHLMLSGTVVTFFGDPGALNESGAETAFLTNPGACSGSALDAHFALDSWEDPGRWLSGEPVMYPEVSGCGALRFEPAFSFAPSATGEGGSTQADEPSGYTAELQVPQTTGFNELATPALKTATVTLPAGVVLSPAAAQGLVGCQEQGPEGINIGSSDLAPDGQDLGDPEATELGEGHAGGNGSPYDDGMYHTARGHCPEASTIGTAEVFTPLLADGPGGSAPLRGRVYLAAPKCGGAGQPACSEASAANGELFGLYMELEGPSGVVVKVPGTTSVSPQSGQVTAVFRESPQFPFSDLKLRLEGGPRAPLANPQACGQASTSALLEPWSAPATPNTSTSNAFSVDWDGNGGACPAGLPFAPVFSAGSANTTAGAFSAFSTTFSRQDREQDLTGVSVSLPPGLLGSIKGVALCGEPQAAQGSCPAASQIGTATVAAGSGPDPLWVEGRVYLTGSYENQPYGLSVVVPAAAGPFNLGNVVVRAAIHIDPNTAALTIISDPLPQIVDGVPLRVRTVNVTVNRPGFTFNPTSCAQQQITGTVTGSQGASVGVGSPFAVSGCQSLAFTPSFTVFTDGSTSKQSGASLTVRYTVPVGDANTRGVAVSLPKQLPARLTTIQQACTETQFAANPAGCPAASAIGTATASTPVLANPVSGPVYLVSHGGAAFPDVVAILQGEGVTVDLTGTIDIKNGITSSTFGSVPDVPVGAFEMTLPEGPHSGLAANLPKSAKNSMCGQGLTMPTAITAQNGAVIRQNTKLTVTGCTKAKVVKKKKPKHKKKHHKAHKKGSHAGRK